ncbi:MAG: FAD-dependent thymidylate synthase [Clostridiales bacterium]|nr:FAD-dependent thymidylate synthase [Clostridiales bacterium]
MAATALHVELLRLTPDPEQVVAMGARLCYSKADVTTLKQRVEKNDQQNFIKRLMEMGHASVMEHASFTFAIEGISRICLAQLTRHRIASFSVQSQRYVFYKDGFRYIVPPNIEALGQEAVNAYQEQMATIQGWYEAWQEKLGTGEQSNEDARFVLPGACETKLVMTMNARELMHFFSLRMCYRAQWEIRELATQMHRLCLEVAPALFEQAGSACLNGPCPEGEKSCGRAKEIREQRQLLLNQLRQRTEEK